MIRGSYLPSRETLLATYRNLPLHIRINCKQLIRSYCEEIGNTYRYSFMINEEIFISYVIDYAPAKRIIKAYKEPRNRKKDKKRKFGDSLLMYLYREK
jgi:hypothetical protein